MIGVWRPTMAPSVAVDKPDTLARVMTGVAIAPKATGAVFATNARTAALSGLKPTAISITEVTATGVPNPANASSDAPKENAMTIAWMRKSSLTVETCVAARRNALSELSFDRPRAH